MWSTLLPCNFNVTFEFFNSISEIGSIITPNVITVAPIDVTTSAFTDSVVESLTFLILALTLFSVPPEYKREEDSRGSERNKPRESGKNYYDVIWKPIFASSKKPISDKKEEDEGKESDKQLGTNSRSDMNRLMRYI
jgi:hypothetical protein